MTVHVVNGNLLESDCDVIIHQANCFNTMGAGIAKQIRSLYPAVFDADQQYRIPIASPKRLGRTSHAWVDGPEGRLLVINLYGQYRYGKGPHTEYDAFKRALRNVMIRLELLEAKNMRHYKVGLPFGIGAGLAGGQWSIISEIISSVSKEFDTDIYLYKL